MSKLTAYFETQGPLIGVLLLLCCSGGEQRYAGGCDMTKGEAPLQCYCGKHSAVFCPPKKQQPGRWTVLEVKVEGRKPRPVTTLADKEKALDRVRSLCCPTAATSTQPQAEPAQQPSNGTATRQTPRAKASVNYDDTARRASCPAGPGRGHTGKRSASALDEADAVLKKPRATAEELRGALVKLSDEHRLLNNWFHQVKAERERAYSLLRDEYLLASDEKADEKCKQDRRALITEMVGEGYDFSGSQRTFQRHKALAIGYIKRLSGKDNTVGQQQLAEAMMCHYKADNEAAANEAGPDYEAHAAVIAGLVETLETLRKRNGGRYPTKDRITQEVILNSAVSKAKGKMLRAIARLLKQSRSSVCKAAKRMHSATGEEEAEDSEDSEDSDGAAPEEFFTLEEKSCNAYPVEHAEYVQRCWDDLTRASECAKDEVTDPVAHSSGAHATHRCATH